MKPHLPLILASQSPRRIDLLTNLGWDFEVHPSKFEEISSGSSPEELAIHNAAGKAKSVANDYQEGLIIGVDTIGVLGDEILGKPKDPEDAKRIVSLLSGTTHQVISGVAVFNAANGELLTEAETTDITMDQLTEEQINAYVDSGEGEDKAGAYAIQGLGSLFIKKINGDYYNVVGLPINRLYKMIQKCSITNAS